jgi:5-methylcytosine-specific restriction endonuclease McrA
MTSKWQQIRLQALERDGFVCQHCGCSNKLDIHHKTSRGKGGLDILENLRWMPMHTTATRAAQKTV